MGIFGALNTAVSGLRAQSFALENISGNIANSQTTAFKRQDTGFADMVTGGASSSKLQRSGSVSMFSRSTASVQGDISASSIDTHMGVSGDGYFMVQEKVSTIDNRAVFSGTDVYTRRGDFSIDQEGYLVNGSGYYLKGLELDPTTGNPVGSIAELIQLSNDFLPAQATEEIIYRANLASFPLTANSDPDVANSEVLNASGFSADPRASSTAFSTITGLGASLTPDAAAVISGSGASLSSDAPASVTGTGAGLSADAPATATGTADISALSATGGVITVNGTNVTINAADNSAAILTAINTLTGTHGVTASLTVGNELQLDSADADTDIVLGGDATTLVEIGYTGGGTVGAATNLLTQGFTTGETLEFTIGSGATQTITFGTGGAQVSTLAELTVALAAITDATASIDGSGNLSVVGTNNEDAITIGGTSDSALLGTSDATTEATNLLSQGFTQGETLEITVGTGATQTITFGTGVGEVSTLAELTAELGNITDATATISGSGNLSIVGASNEDDITVGGTSNSTLLGTADSTTAATNLLSQGFSQGQTLEITVGTGAAQTITFGTGVGEVSTLDELNTELGALTGVVASVDTANGNISVVANNGTDSVELGGTAPIASLGTTAGTYLPAAGVVIANDNTNFINSSVSGGAITVFDPNGSPVNVQFRWAKVDSTGLGGADTWNMFYLEDPDATGTDTQWRNVGQDYTFDASGQLDPQVTQLTLTNLTVGGVSLGNINLVHGTDGLTQYDDSNGNAQVNSMTQDGMPSGELVGIQIADGGTVVGNYSNGLSLNIVEIPLVSFNAEDGLKRLDGGGFEATSESGQAILDATGTIVGQSLENSNTDIADEFSKLIVTQQAYSANSRIITSADEMLQEALNMVR
ncbi:MAG: flagellar hook-basal body complex protein [Hyphomicrobiales bacterium]